MKLFNMTSIYSDLEVSSSDVKLKNIMAIVFCLSKLCDGGTMD